MLADLTTTVTEDATERTGAPRGAAGRWPRSPRCARSCPSRPTRSVRISSTCARDTRMIGGPNPDGRYLLAMIRGDRTYRVTGTRGSTAYLGFQVLAGTGLTPRRMAGYVSDTELALRLRRRSRLLLSAIRTAAGVLGDAQWVPIPADASSIVVREYIGDPATEQPATMRIECLDRRSAATDLRRRGGRGVHRDGVDHRQAHHAAPHHQARTAHPAQHPGDRRGRRTRRRGHHPRQPVHDRHLRARARRIPGARVRTARHPLLERHAGEHLARMPGTAAPAQLRHQQGRRARTPTASCGSPSAPRTSVTVTGWTPADGTAASSSCGGSTTPLRPTVRTTRPPRRAAS